MAQYIDKSALVAEIERIKEMYCYDTKTNASFVAEAVINSIKNVINSIEVKEMNLQEETKTDWLRELQERLDSLSKEDFDKVLSKYSRYGEEGYVDYDKLNTMLDESLYNETNESWNERLGEEPVSEDLEKAAEQDVCEVVNTCSATGIPNDHITLWVQDAMINEFIHGANWKEKQFEKNRLKHCDSITNEQAELEQKFVDQHLDKYQRMPTFLDAIEYGMRLKEEQMMENTADATIGLPYENKDGGYTHLVDVSRPLPVGNNKIAIIFKEDLI